MQKREPEWQLLREPKEDKDGNGNEYVTEEVKRKNTKKWKLVVVERRSFRLLRDNMTAGEKARDIKKMKKLEDNYPQKGKKQKPCSVASRVICDPFAKNIDIEIENLDDSKPDSSERELYSARSNVAQEAPMNSSLFDFDVSLLGDHTNKNGQGKHPEKK